MFEYQYFANHSNFSYFKCISNYIFPDQNLNALQEKENTYSSMNYIAHHLQQYTQNLNHIQHYKGRYLQRALDIKSELRKNLKIK